jgi:hypothetical protein|nr:MAG TPA: hypothetical protein [Caudoviricetes sp.]
MKRYKLLKDLPYAKEGEVFERVTHKSEDGLSDYDYLEIKKRVKDGEDEVNFGIKYNYFLNNFDEWFEKIEPTNSIHWKPEQGDEYFWIDECGSILPGTFYRDSLYDQQRLTFGNVYRTEKEAEKARERRLAEVRLRQTSTFEPDFENRNGGWAVGYNHRLKMLIRSNIPSADFGEPVRYATAEDARRSIEENREDWKIYFGIKEEK